MTYLCAIYRLLVGVVIGLAAVTGGCMQGPSLWRIESQGVDR